jgi:16S rRNA processing protein RimM
VIEAGRVGRPHGLDGSFHVTRALGALLGEGTTVEVAGRSARVERRAGTDERPIVRLTGCTRREDAEALRGAALLVTEADAPPLEEGEYWASELEGCAVHDGERAIGTVRRMITLPSCEALEVQRPDGDDVLVPLVHDAIRSIDRDARRIDVNMDFLGA